MSYELSKLIQENQLVSDQPSVNARDLHVFLESKQQFSDWMQNKIKQYDFVEERDFYINLYKNDKKGRPTKEYVLTLHMAKELSMVENNKKGKEARLYFIHAEEELQIMKFEEALRAQRLYDMEATASFMRTKTHVAILDENTMLKQEMRNLKTSYMKLQNLAFDLMGMIRNSELFSSSLTIRVEARFNSLVEKFGAGKLY